MQHSIIRRSLSLVLLLALALPLTTAVRAAETGSPEFTLLEITPTDVVMERSEFVYSGQPIEPKVTVTVEDTVLTEGKDYTITYVNNLAPGTGTLTVKGIATASETLGYYGKVSMDFTIVRSTDTEAPTDPEDPTEPETPSEPSQPAPEETAPVDYQITKGSGSKWNQKSGKDLSFTVNADTEAVTAISINGTPLEKTHYALGSDGRITLKNSWLEEQPVGTYRLTVSFADGEAEGKFTVLAAADPTNPQTGDTSALWLMILAVSASTAAILLKKRPI